MYKLSIASQQLVEIGRAIAVGARVLVLDEPTSSLARNDIERLFELVRRLESNKASESFTFRTSWKKSGRFAIALQFCETGKAWQPERWPRPPMRRSSRRWSVVLLPISTRARCARAEKPFWI